MMQALCHVCGNRPNPRGTGVCSVACFQRLTPRESS